MCQFGCWFILFYFILWVFVVVIVSVRIFLVLALEPCCKTVCVYTQHMIAYRYFTFDHFLSLSHFIFLGKTLLNTNRFGLLFHSFFLSYLCFYFNFFLFCFKRIKKLLNSNFFLFLAISLLHLSVLNVSNE